MRALVLNGHGAATLSSTRASREACHRRPRARPRAYAGGRGETPRSRCRSPTEATPLGAEDLELLATSAYMLGRDDEYLERLERAHHLTSTPASRCARRAARSGSASISPARGDRAARTDGSAARSGCVERERARLRRAGLPAAAAHVPARGRRRPRGRARRRRRRRGDRRALRRRGPVRPRRARSQGTCWSGWGGSRRASGCWTRRWWRSRGRAVADRHRPRLLRRDRRLPGGRTSCAAPGSGRPR